MPRERALMSEWKVGSKIYDVGAAWRGWVRRGVGYDKRDATKSGGKMGATVSGML